MFIMGIIEFVKEIGKEEVLTRVSSRMRKYWPHDEKVQRRRKFRAAFEYFKSRSNQTNTRSCVEAQADFTNDSKVKHQEARPRPTIATTNTTTANTNSGHVDSKLDSGSNQIRDYSLYIDLFDDYLPKIPKISTDLFNMAYKRHKMGQLHKWIFSLMNTVSDTTMSSIV